MRSTTGWRRWSAGSGGCAIAWMRSATPCWRWTTKAGCWSATQLPKRCCRGPEAPAALRAVERQDRQVAAAVVHHADAHRVADVHAPQHMLSFARPGVLWRRSHGLFLARNIARNAGSYSSCVTTAHTTGASMVVRSRSPDNRCGDGLRNRGAGTVGARVAGENEDAASTSRAPLLLPYASTPRLLPIPNAPPPHGHRRGLQTARVCENMPPFPAKASHVLQRVQGIRHPRPRARRTE